MSARRGVFTTNVLVGGGDAQQSETCQVPHIHSAMHAHPKHATCTANARGHGPYLCVCDLRQVPAVDVAVEVCDVVAVAETDVVAVVVNEELADLVSVVVRDVDALVVRVLVWVLVCEDVWLDECVDVTVVVSDAVAVDVCVDVLVNVAEYVWVL